MTASTKVRTKKFIFFIGIDISKNKLDYAVMKDKQLLFHRITGNLPEDIVAFVMELKTLPGFKISNAIFCMEQTGHYGNHVLESLKKLKANIVVENPVQIKNSLGLIRGKNDKVDAIRIAQYAHRRKEEFTLWAPRRPAVLQLASLFATRNRLLMISVALKTPLTEQTLFVQKKLLDQNIQSCERSITAMKEDLVGINKRLEMIIKSDERLKRLAEVITSVPCVGLVTAIQIIICTNEFRDITSPKKFACYAGVAPFKKESGSTNSRARVSHVANKKIKSLLHICAMGAVRCDPELKLYYHKKTKIEGKPNMAVINAIRFKLILRVFACLNQDRLYTKDYVRSKDITAGELVYASS